MVGLPSTVLIIQTKRENIMSNYRRSYTYGGIYFITAGTARPLL
ncbi:hypothetical protein l11_00190 [Neisseria weaveri LMG 5135]|nr:hypothetical protein l11_00190 [Neisseria weaveri LMG 5135]